jgi:hypothetical protein
MLVGWQINYLDTPEAFTGFMKNAGFTTATCKDITPFVMHSSRKLLGIYILAMLYGFGKQ